MFVVALPLQCDKEFNVCSANSRAALTPSNVHRTFSVRHYRFWLVIGGKCVSLALLPLGLCWLVVCL